MGRFWFSVATFVWVAGGGWGVWAAEPVAPPIGPESVESAELAALRARIEQLESEVAAQSLRPLPPVVEGGAPLPAPAVAPAPCVCCPPKQKPLFGYDRGFFIRTPEDAFALKINGLLQWRYVSTWREAPPAGEDPNEFGFVLERTPVIFSGHAFSPQLNYFLLLQAHRSDGRHFLEEAKLFYEFSHEWVGQVGRFRNPALLRELDVSYTRQLTIERSYLTSLFTTGVLEGALLRRQGDCLSTTLILSDGRHSGSVARKKDFFEDFSDYAVTFGLDWKLFGEWAQFGDLASWPDEGPALLLSAGVHYEKGETGDSLAANDLNDFIEWTCDVSYEHAGLTLMGVVVGRHSLVDGEAIDQTGVMFLGGYQLIPEVLEPYVNYQYLALDGFSDVGSGKVAVEDSSVNIVTAGANWYFHRHGCKLSLEVTHAFDAIPVAKPNTGLLQDDAGGQTVLMSQLQFFF